MQLDFDIDINHYTYDDLKKLFNVKEEETITPSEIDMRISNLIYSVENSCKHQNEITSIKNFLQVAKEKFNVFVNSQEIKYNNVYPMTERLKKTFKPNSFLDKNEHVVIEHKPDIDIPMEFKYVNISSSDRDIISWPYSSNFEINLPDTFKDVNFLTMYDYNFYCHVFNFTEFYQNTKITFSYEGNNSIPKTTVNIPDGYYTEENLFIAICDAMNAVTNVSGFKTYFNANSKRLAIYNDNTGTTSFKLYFNEAETYPSSKWQMRNIYNLNSAWGMGFFLGFQKEEYESTSYTTLKDNSGATISTPTQAIIAPNILNIILNNNVFLEIDGFNHVFQTRNENGVGNSYFSRIPLLNGFANDVGGFERANISAETISKLKFKIRFHNGILLDLQSQNYDFTLMIGCKK